MAVASDESRGRGLLTTDCSLRSSARMISYPDPTLSDSENWGSPFSVAERDLGIILVQGQNVLKSFSGTNLRSNLLFIFPAGWSIKSENIPVCTETWRQRATTDQSVLPGSCKDFRHRKTQNWHGDQTAKWLSPRKAISKYAKQVSCSQLWTCTDWSTHPTYERLVMFKSCWQSNKGSS